MPYETTSVFEIATLLRGVNAKKIAIDGADGSGKSTLARELGTTLGLRIVHLDDFVDRGKGAFFEHLNLAAVAEDIASDKPILIEGICMLQVLEAIGVEADAIVYVKRMGDHYWLDEGHLDPDGPLEEHLAVLRTELAPIAAKLGESGDLGLAEEVIRYHANYRPHEGATVAFLRRDS